MKPEYRAQRTRLYWAPLALEESRMGRGTGSERPSEVAGQASDTETAMSNMMAETVAFDDYEPCCVVCGHELAWVECHMIDCDEGSYDAYDEDPIFFSPGDRMTCSECGGRGGWWFCDHCNTERMPGPPAKELPGAKP